MRLTPQQLGDEDLLALAIDELAQSDRGMMHVSRAVVERQEELHGLVDAEGREACLRVEEATNARAARLLVLVARWAFEEGRRWGRGRR